MSIVYTYFLFRVKGVCCPALVRRKAGVNPDRSPIHYRSEVKFTKNAKQ